jgi:DNA-binding IclR family transcriptional regulator
MERSKAESFTAYLEARQQERAAPAAPASGGTSFSLLAALAGAPQWTMTLAELQQASGMSFGDFSQSLQPLVDTGYLTLSGQPGSETAQLTKLGSQVADLARAS